jgi:hypothetical protein
MTCGRVISVSGDAMGAPACRVLVASGCHRHRRGRAVHEVVAVHDMHAEDPGNNSEH